MRGSLGDGYYVIISSPLESIQESAALSNQLLILVGTGIGMSVSVWCGFLRGG